MIRCILWGWVTIEMTYTQPNLDKSALLTIDVQRDFTLPGAPAEMPGAMAVVPNIARILDGFRNAGLPIIHVVRLYLQDGSNVDPCRRKLIEDGTTIVAPDTVGAQIVAEILPDSGIELNSDLLLNGDIQTLGPKETVIYKPRWGAFFGTTLQKHLLQYNVNTLVVSGFNYPNCPRATIYEASERDFRIVLVKDAISGLYARGEAEMKNIGIRLWSTDYLMEKTNMVEE